MPETVPFRFVRVVNETIEYDGVSLASAVAVDRIIDSLWWR